MPKPTTVDLRQQVGQLLIMGFEGKSLESKLRTTLTSLRPGGVILFARNLESAQQTWSLLHDCQDTARQPMFLCVDMEGGAVDRIKNVIAPVPPAEKVFAAQHPWFFHAHGNLIGLELRALGFNTDFAPVLDLGLPASRSVLTSRTVSGDPVQVIRYAREFLAGLKAAKVLGCGKHFPGLGGAPLDSHQQMPTVRRSWKQMWAGDLMPYRQLHQRLPFIMVSHAYYPQITREKIPASLSYKWITGILRDKIGYRGVIISDDLEMGGALAAGSIEDVAVETINAGADIFLVCRDQELVWRAYEAVLRRAEKDRKFFSRVKEAAGRISKVKGRSSELHYASARPTAKIVKTLKRVAQDYMQAVEEHQA